MTEIDDDRQELEDARTLARDATRRGLELRDHLDELLERHRRGKVESLLDHLDHPHR